MGLDSPFTNRTTWPIRLRIGRSAHRASGRLRAEAGTRAAAAWEGSSQLLENIRGTAMPRQTLSAIAFVVLLPGCAIDGLAASHDDACVLLSQQQVSATLGVSVEAGKPVSVRMCQWEQSDVRGPKGKRVLLTVFGQMGSLSPVDRFNNSKRSVSGISKESVSGVGDDAVFIPTMGLALNVRSGTSAFQIRVSGAGLSQDQLKQMEIALAKEVIAKL